LRFALALLILLLPFAVAVLLWRRVSRAGDITRRPVIAVLVAGASPARGELDRAARPGFATCR